MERINAISVEVKEIEEWYVEVMKKNNCSKLPKEILRDNRSQASRLFPGGKQRKEITEIAGTYYTVVYKWIRI